MLCGLKYTANAGCLHGNARSVRTARCPLPFIMLQCERLRPVLTVERPAAVQSITDLIQAIARQRGRGDASPLIMLRELDGAPGERVSHLPVEGDLAQAWLALTGEPFRPHQAQALTAFRRGEPVALCSANPTVANSAYLLIYAALVSIPPQSALVVAADDRAAAATHAAIEALNAGLPRDLRLPVLLVEPGVRPNPAARIVISTASDLHGRLLRHHDRAWQPFWSNLRLVIIPDIQAYHGVAGAHLVELLARARRIAFMHTRGGTPGFIATLTELTGPQVPLEGVLGVPWRMIMAEDLPCDATTLAIWHGTGDRLREAADLGSALNREGFHVHVVCQAIEEAALAAQLDGIKGISFGAQPVPAHVLIAAGFPESLSRVRALLCAGYQAVMIVLGQAPHERTLALHSESLLLDPPTAWPELPSNAYVTAQHVLCAASELPLTDEEVQTWGVQDIVARMVADNRLADLPDPEVAWKPTPSAGDPYEEFSMLSASGSAIECHNDQGQAIGAVDPTWFERWGFLNAALPPGQGGLRVTGRDEDAATLLLRREASGRRVFPLRRCKVEVRSEREQRRLFSTHQITWGRVLIEEEIYGYREATPAGGGSDQALRPPLETRWVAPACWFDLADDLQVLGQCAGWSVAGALPLRVLATLADLVPCYDHEARRMYLVDSQPGGNGLSLWVYAHAEDLLPLAYDVALACRNDPLFEPMARADMDWLLGLLGRRARQPVPAEQPAPATAPIEYITAPPVPPSVERTEQVEPPPPRRNTPPRVTPPQREQRRRPDPPRRAGQRPAERPPDPPAAAPDEAPDATQGALWSAPDTGRIDRRADRPPRRTPDRHDPPAEAPPDASAMIERLRRQREQREPPRQPVRQAPPAAPIEPRFAAGDRIFCLPYGDGVVIESRIEGDRELLAVEFPVHGTLTIDPAISLVRKIEAPPPAEEDLFS